ncbi:MAG: hypothetical protein IKR34_02055 [Candidatus Gastranaerophilales bacterium]|nr:hypothetical protein [Elusimicrobiota bacterium]MBR6298007.1 hypothetical protein [Candidatus Gastranaerophilales bacterium]
MYFDLSEEGNSKLNKLIEQEVLNNIEIILKDKNYIDKLVSESLKGSIKAIINEILQSKNYRNILRDRIMQQLKLEQE